MRARVRFFINMAHSTGDVMVSYLLTVSGVVQGVGFRPFVYRTAVSLGLKGYVKNIGDGGVEIFLEGSEGKINEFVDKLRRESPPLAKISHIHIENVSPGNYEEFVIEKSEKREGEGLSIIPPDVGICDKCAKELFDPTNPRYLYPFIVCTDCGPRFTIIEDLPYDRENTSMREFPMCNFCKNEYEDPLNRRYHAEPVCCARCGPQYTLYTPGREKIPGDPIKNAANLIDEGYIVAVKGIGGIHLACDATEEDVVAKLRRRLGREQQPFALMARNIETVKKYAHVSKEEEEELKSYRKPIVLLTKKENCQLPKNLAPGLHTLGFMLPYAGTHLLLFHYSSSSVYVMTSANRPDMPMVIDNEKAFQELQGIADYFLLHNRRIVNRTDDSVVRFVHGRALVRRSRGFVPLPLEFPSKARYLAMGAELMNSFSMTKKGQIYPSQYMGNASKLEVVEFIKRSVEHFKKILRIDAWDAIIADKHPTYLTSKFAAEMSEALGVPLLKIQHHFAHIGSVMLEHKLQEAIGIALDGVGYGDDGAVWGGEVLILSPGEMRRYGHIDYYSLPGGDLAAYYPIRALVGLLVKSGENVIDFLEKYVPGWRNMLPHGEKEMEIILKQVGNGINTPQSSSAGRFLDAISVLLGVAYRRTYEGEPAMKLESVALRGAVRDVEVPVRQRRIYIGEIIPQIVNMKRDTAALTAHMALADAMATVAIEGAEKKGIKNVCLSGGVAYNSIITSQIEKRVKSYGLKFFVNHEIPRGDNGISAGQAYVAYLLEN